MKDISIGIYHKDHQYGKRLMEYLNHQKDFPMTASFTSDEEMFFKQEQEGDFECLVLAEETDYHGDFPVCRIGANESMGGMYCQSAKEIAAGIYHCLNVSPQIENERIFGVYSPISRLEISAFARNMAASNGWIYFGMQPYGHFVLLSQQATILVSTMDTRYTGRMVHRLLHLMIQASWLRWQRLHRLTR